MATKLTKGSRKSEASRSLSSVQSKLKLTTFMKTAAILDRDQAGPGHGASFTRQQNQHLIERESLRLSRWESYISLSASLESTLLSLRWLAVVAALTLRRRNRPTFGITKQKLSKSMSTRTEEKSQITQLIRNQQKCRCVLTTRPVSLASIQTHSWRRPTQATHLVRYD